MSVHIWCPRASDSALLIRNAITAKGVRCYKSPVRMTAQRVRAFLSRIRLGDTVINWGPPSPEIITEISRRRGVTLLNAARFLNKRDQLVKLAAANIPCPQVFNTPAEGRLGRSLHHQGGVDLLRGYGHDYYTQKVNFDHEIRVHVFNGLAIRTGLKMHRPNFPNPHPWIRTYDGGWFINYGRAKDIRQDRRELAKRAVAALDLNFGAVDMGITDRGTPMVIEINTAPGLDDGPSVDAYVRHILGNGG